DQTEKFINIKGVGRKTVAVLMACLPELGKVSNKAIAALVGVAPYPKDSGNLQGKRHCRGGRALPRSTLYMATLCAVRHEPAFKHFYERLLEKGKSKKCSLVACIRKMIVIINTLLKT
ncbi:transposase, partial [Lonepinella sp. BR2271]|uniref:transposase n=1 Tax=Lonepinella sp. BR2271 TaxID=3434550 RepID=UPI003F6E02C4